MIKVWTIWNWWHDIFNKNLHYNYFHYQRLIILTKQIHVVQKYNPKIRHNIQNPKSIMNIILLLIRDTQDYFTLNKEDKWFKLSIIIMIYE